MPRDFVSWGFFCPQFGTAHLYNSLIITRAYICFGTC
nr:MAG TPA: hypothetical protein [Caudoviricetes sp.]